MGFAMLFQNMNTHKDLPWQERKWEYIAEKKS
jgi:hypothetical protein